MNQLQVGQRLHCILYGGKDGTIVEVHGGADQGPVRSLARGVVMMGGRCSYDVIWDNGSESRMTPEAIVHGVQWRIYPEIVGPEAVAAARTQAVIYKAEQQAKADEEKRAKAAADAIALEAGRAKGLIPEAEFRAAGKRGSAAAWNLRQELKKAGIDGSVKQDGYNALRVRIDNERDAEAASEIGLKYKAGNFDGMTDCYEYSSNAWGRVFGDVQYVFVTKPNGCMA